MSEGWATLNRSAERLQPGMVGDNLSKIAGDMTSESAVKPLARFLTMQQVPRPCEEIDDNSTLIYDQSTLLREDLTARVALTIRPSPRGLKTMGECTSGSMMLTVKELALAADLADWAGEDDRCISIIARIYELFDDQNYGVAPNITARILAGEAAAWLSGSVVIGA